MSHNHEASHDANGIPIVMTTSPGEERRDFERYRCIQSAKFRSLQSNGSGDSRFKSISLLLKHQNKPPAETRTFHLTRELIAGLQPRSLVGTNRQSLLRPHLPTFIERTHDATVTAGLPASADTTTKNADTTPAIAEESRQVKGKRVAQSVHADPSTWDLESDELANQLAAIAFELDPSAKPPAPLPADKVIKIADRTTKIQEFVFETYVRMRTDLDMDTEMIDANNLGYLVIGDEDEDLWEQYLKEEDDDQGDSWDEEDQDSNAEDNPRNDYPEDELSSDDEYDRNPYRHRRHASDEEGHDEGDYLS